MSTLYKDIEKFPYMGYAPTLIDYFLLIGYESTFVSNFIVNEIEILSQKNKPNLSKQNFIFNLPIQPSVLSSIAANQKHNVSMLNNDLIIDFTFPNPPAVIYGTHQKSLPPYNVIFGSYGDSSELEESDISKKIYNGYSFVFYEQRKIQDIYVFIPKAFTFLTQFPYFLLFNNISQELLKLFSNPIDIPIEILLYNLVNFIPSPISYSLNITFFPNYQLMFLDSSLKNKKEQEEIILNSYYQKKGKTPFLYKSDQMFQAYTIDQMKGYPIIDFNLADILHVLTPSQVIQILLFSFLEIDMIFFSKQIEILNLVMYITSILSYPCVDSTYLWHILSISKNDLKSSTTNPFVGKTFTGMLGVNCEYDESFVKELSKLYQMYFTVDLDNKEIYFFYRTDEGEQIAQCVYNLKCFVEKTNDENKKNKNSFLGKAINLLMEQLMLASKKIIYTHVSTNNKETSFFHDESVNKRLNTNIQEACYNFILTILKEFYNFFSINHKDQDNECNLSLSNITINDDTISNTLKTATESLFKNDHSSMEEKNNLEVSCIETNEKIPKQNTNYIMHYNENTKNYCIEEKNLFTLFHQTNKFVRFVKEFVPHQQSINIYKIPMMFAEEFLLLKNIFPSQFKLDYFNMIDSFYTFELKIKNLNFKIQQVQSNAENLANNSEEPWKAKDIEEFLFIEQGTQIVNFDNFYQYYDKKLKEYFFKEVRSISNIGMKIQSPNNPKYKYQTINLDKNIIIQYANYLSNINNDELMDIFPSIKIINNNVIKKVSSRAIINSIEKELVYLKLVTVEHLIIYSILLLLCAYSYKIEENDLDELLRFLSHDLLSIRKYLSMLIFFLYHESLVKWKTKKEEESIPKEVKNNLKYIRKIISYLNYRKIFPNENLSSLMESICLLEKDIKRKYPNVCLTSVLQEINYSFVEQSFTSSKSEEEISIYSDGNKNKKKEELKSSILNISMNDYEITILNQQCLSCGNINKISIAQLIHLSNNIEYEGSFDYICTNQDCKNKQNNQFHKMRFINKINNKEYDIEIFSPLKLYNVCASIISDYLNNLTPIKTNETQLSEIFCNLIYYLDNFDTLRNKTFSISKILFKYFNDLV